MNYDDIKDEDLERFSQNDLEMLARRSIATLLKKTHSIKVIPNPKGNFSLPLAHYSNGKEEEKIT